MLKTYTKLAKGSSKQDQIFSELLKLTKKPQIAPLIPDAHITKSFTVLLMYMTKCTSS